jgi:hypothetical protein
MRRSIVMVAVAILGSTIILQVPGSTDRDSGFGAHRAHNSTAFAEARTFESVFDGQPERPQPWRATDWDVVVNLSDSWIGGHPELQPMEAQHGSGCEPPPATHPITAVDDAVFLCNGHVMTAMNYGYGAIFLTPNQLLDFSDTEAVLSWDMSTIRNTERDWVDVWVTPFEDNLVLPVEHWLPAYQGEPRRAIHVRMDGGNNGTIFRGFVVEQHTSTELHAGGAGGYETFLQPSAVRRDTFELRISRTHIRFGMPAYNQWWVDDNLQGLGWDRGVIQFGHHAYDPTKGCDGPCANTWHWDNIRMSPVIPFTVLRGSSRFVTPQSNPAVTFESEAPEGAFLRFAGVGENLEISFDGGLTWVPARRQAQKNARKEHFSSFWTPIPAGVSNVRLRSNKPGGDPWMIQDVAIWGPNTVTMAAATDSSP